MTRATYAVFKSKSRALADTLHLTPAEVVDLSLRLVVEYAPRSGLDGAALHDRLGDMLAAHAVEGGNGGSHE